MATTSPSTPSTLPPRLPVPLSRRLIPLTGITRGIPSRVNVTQWGSPLDQARHVVFFFGGMPASAEEPSIHSAVENTDVYADRKIHLICIDKPGMGLSSMAYNFQIRRDWPVVVHQVATQLQVNSRYGVMGVSNGGPYVMSALTHPTYHRHVKAGCMIVSVSDVWASGYFSYRTPSTLFEGLYNSLPIVVTGPLNAMALSLLNVYLFSWGKFETVFRDYSHPELVKEPIRRVISDGARNWGWGAALDCQQGLSPLWARSSKNHDPTSVDRNATEAYRNISVPVSLWYGTQDASVPMSSAEWLANQIPNATLHQIEAGHGLYWYHAAKVLDDLVERMNDADEAEKAAKVTKEDEH